MEGTWFFSLENSTISPLASSDGISEDGELKLGVSELEGSGSSDFILFVEDHSLNDGNGVRRCSMISRHFRVKLADSSIERNISVLFVHVDMCSSRLISQDNTESFDMIGSSLKDFINAEDLSLSSFGFELTTEMVPEFGFGDDFVDSKKSDSIDLGVGLFFGGSFASKDEILSNLRIIFMSTFIWREGSVGS